MERAGGLADEARHIRPVLIAARLGLFQQMENAAEIPITRIRKMFTADFTDGFQSGVRSGVNRSDENGRQSTSNNALAVLDEDASVPVECVAPRALLPGPRQPCRPRRNARGAARSTALPAHSPGSWPLHFHLISSRCLSRQGRELSCTIPNHARCFHPCPSDQSAVKPPRHPRKSAHLVGPLDLVPNPAERMKTESVIATGACDLK